LQRGFQVVNVVLQFGEARVFHRGNAYGFLLGHVGPGAIVSPFELGIKFLEKLAVRATGEWISSGFDVAHLEAADALQRVERPTRGFSKFAVVHDVNARVSLLPHHFGDRIFQRSLVRQNVGRLAALPPAHFFQKLRWPNQTAYMRR
jgi:hypothetical protein